MLAVAQKQPTEAMKASLLVRAMCRQEWLSQRPLRTASLQYVHKVEAKPDPCSDRHASFWVAGAAPDSPCYLISTRACGAWALLDPSLRNAQPKQLDMPSSAYFHAFVPADGQLHIVELTHSQSEQLRNASSLHWHTINTATGQTVASEEKHMWFKNQTSSIFHASGRVLSLLDNTTLAMMDAVTLHELLQGAISPRGTHPSLQMGRAR